MERDERNRLVISKVVLHPQIEWIGESIPTPLEIERLHQLAHEECFIANSIRSEVTIAANSDKWEYPFSSPLRE